MLCEFYGLMAIFSPKFEVYQSTKYFSQREAGGFALSLPVQTDSYDDNFGKKKIKGNLKLD